MTKMNKISFISSLVFYIFFLLLFTNCHGAAHPSAQGNSHITLNVKNGKSSEKHILKGNASDLWCQATLDGYTTLPLRESYFENINTKRVYFSGQKDQDVKVDIINGNRTYLQLSNNETSINESGKYVCVLTTEDGQRVRQDLFVNLRPVFHTNGSLRLKIEDEKLPFQITASSTKVLRGETAVLGCPAISYPTPSIIWYKGENKTPLDLKSSERYESRGNELIIHNVEDTDEEIYRCVASNSFSIDVNGTSSYETFTTTLDQKLWVAKHLAWLTPLLIILIMVSLLFSIVCFVRIRKQKQRKQQYNAEKSLS